MINWHSQRPGCSARLLERRHIHPHLHLWVRRSGDAWKVELWSGYVKTHVRSDMGATQTIEKTSNNTNRRSTNGKWKSIHLIRCEKGIQLRRQGQKWGKRIDASPGVKTNKMDDTVRHDFLRYFAYDPYYDPAVLEGDNALARAGVRLWVDFQSRLGCRGVVEDHRRIAPC